MSSVRNQVSDREGHSTKVDVREFLEANFASIPLQESEGAIRAGSMEFAFDEGGKMSAVYQEIPCPIS
jgi:hypothetical protein